MVSYLVLLIHPFSYEKLDLVAKKIYEWPIFEEFPWIQRGVKKSQEKSGGVKRRKEELRGVKRSQDESRGVKRSQEERSHVASRGGKRGQDESR